MKRIALMLALALSATSAAANTGTINDWAEKLGNRLSAEMASAGQFANHSGPIVVTFRRGPDGRPADIRVVGPAGGSAVQAAAERTLRRLGRLPQLPDGVPAGSRVRLQLLLSPSAREQQHAEVSGQQANRQLAARVTETMQIVRVDPFSK